MGKLHQIQHPLLAYKLSILRNTETQIHTFREILGELSVLLLYEYTKTLTTKATSIITPLGPAEGVTIADKLTLVAVLRSGLPMVEGILKTLPFCRVGHIGIYRDKTIKNTIEYYFKLPENVTDSKILICDPIVATGDTMVAAIYRLKQYAVGEISIVSLLCGPNAFAKIHEHHPDVNLYTASVEPEINQKGYLIPGVGDVADRLYGTL